VPLLLALPQDLLLQVQVHLQVVLPRILQPETQVNHQVTCLALLLVSHLLEVFTPVVLLVTALL
jgi:hypothetical protein